MNFVYCTEVVRLSESPLLEVSLYIEVLPRKGREYLTPVYLSVKVLFGVQLQSTPAYYSLTRYYHNCCTKVCLIFELSS